MMKQDHAVFLMLPVMVASAFFISFWGRNAEALGQGDMGLALVFSFAVPLSFYASVALVVVAFIGLIVAWRRLRPVRLWLAALLIALLPPMFLALIDLM